MRRLRARPELLLPVLCLLAACGGRSCSCLGPIPGGFPTDGRRHENAIQVRVTGAALDYLEANGPALLGAFLPGGGTTVDIPPTGCSGGKNRICCGSPPPTCSMDLDVQSVNLRPAPPNALAFTVSVGLKSKQPFPGEFDVLVGTARCMVSIDTGNKTIGVSSTATFTVDPATRLTSVNLTGTDIAGLDGGMIDLAPQPGDLWCYALNWDVIKNILIGVLKQQLADQITKAAEGSFCAACSSRADCDALADDCAGGQCMRQGKCLQEIGAAGRLDVAALSSLFASTRASLDVLAVLGGYAAVPDAPAGGLSLGLLGGGQAAAHDPCVPMRPAPTTPDVGHWSLETANLEPSQNKPYHVGIGIHESHLNTLAWSAFDAGALCVDVGTATVPQLDSKTFGLLFPSLNDLVRDVDAPMFLAVRPKEEPHITLGAGTFEVDAMGNKTIKDPLLHIFIPSLTVDIYAFFDQRYDRIATLTADVNLGVGLDVDEKGQLVPMLGNLGSAFSNLTVSNTKLLRESPEALAKTFPPLLGLATSSLGQLSPIVLPKAMGLDLVPVAVEPVDQQKFLALFANLSVGAGAPFWAETGAEVIEVLAPPTEAFRAETGLDPLVQPRVVLALDGAGRGGDAVDLEWSVRLDDGFWTPYQSARRRELTDPRLWLQGRHRVDVRARVVGEPRTTDPTPTRLDFLVDTVPPVGRFDLAGSEAVVDAADLVSPPEALEYSYRLAGGDWSPWTKQARLRIAGRLDPLASGLAARVRDEAGNVGALAFQGQANSVPTGGASGCHVGHGPHPHPGRGLALLVVAALAGALLMRRDKDLLQRVKPWLPLVAAAALVLAALAGCNDDDEVKLEKGQLLDPNDEIGRFSDAVAAGGVIRVSAYDDTTGDLAYTEIKVGDVGKPIEWQWVDGVPEPAMGATAAPDAWRRGVTEPGDDVGQWTSVALTASGDPRIAYYDATHRALRYAAGARRSFHTSAVEAPEAPTARAGLYASLSLDGSGVPSIAYLSTGLPDGAGGFVSKLRLATASRADPGGPGDWNVIDVDRAPIPCAGLCDSSEACVPTDQNDPVKSACKHVDAAPCLPACGAAQACIATACVTVLPARTTEDLPDGTGLFATLRRLSPGGARTIVYHDRNQGDLRLAVETMPGVFQLSTLDGNDPKTDVGQFATSTVAADGTLHVAYEDAISDRLLYKTVKAGVVAPTAEVVDDGLRDDGPHPVGAGAAIWSDGTTVKVAYQDQRLVDLWLGARVGGAWTRQSVKSGSAGYGFYPRLVADGGKLYVTQFVYDRAARAMGAPLGSLAVMPLP